MKSTVLDAIPARFAALVDLFARDRRPCVLGTTGPVHESGFPAVGRDHGHSHRLHLCGRVGLQGVAARRDRPFELAAGNERHDSLFTLGSVAA